MGLENRDYFRDGSYTESLTGLGLDFTPVVKYLILANVAVFLLQIFFVQQKPLPDPEAFESAVVHFQTGGGSSWKQAKKDRPAADDDEEDEIDPQEQEKVRRKYRQYVERMMGNMPGMRVSPVQQWLELDPEKTIKQGQLWRLLTCAFCHSRVSIWHIVFNMIMLYWFGTRLESMYGSREFLLFYLAAALASSLAYVGLAFWTGSNVPAIGASGAVMGVTMLYVIFYPYETILLFWFLPVPLWAMLGLYVIYDLHPVLLQLSGDRVFTGVAHAGHLGGLAFGFLYWKLGLRLEAPFDRTGRPRRLPVRKASCPAAEPAILAHPKRDEFNDQVDDVLRKISEQGTDSLTEQERAILTRASARYRGKE
jgi:membrane associated rhomboid family serine protease